MTAQIFKFYNVWRDRCIQVSHDKKPITVDVLSKAGYLQHFEEEYSNRYESPCIIFAEGQKKPLFLVYDFSRYVYSTILFQIIYYFLAVSYIGFLLGLTELKYRSKNMKLSFNAQQFNLILC